MLQPKYYFPKQIIEQMNLEFTVELATADPNQLVMEQLKVAGDRVEARLHQIDLDFSPFRYDSLVSKYQRGDRTPILESTDFQAVYGQAVLAEQMTDGIFTPYFAGRYDPTSLVKDWAIEQCLDEYLKPLLKNPRIDGVSLSCDGEMRMAVRPNSDFRWEINIVDPADSQTIMTTYYLKGGAVAISDNHKYSESTHNQVEQVTVISNSLIDADIWATVGVSASVEKFAEMINEYHLSGLMISKNSIPLDFNEGAIANVQEIRR